MIVARPDRVAPAASPPAGSAASSTRPSGVSAVVADTVASIRLASPRKRASSGSTGCGVELVRARRTARSRPAAQHRDPVGDRQRLVLVVGDEDGGGSGLAQDLATSARMLARSSTSSDENGSSSSTSAGLRRPARGRARPAAARRPRGGAGSRRSRPARPDQLEQLVDARRRLVAPTARSPKPTLPPTVRCGKSAPSCGHVADPPPLGRHVARGRRRPCWPPSGSSPASTRSKPAIRRSSVVLPLPDGAEDRGQRVRPRPSRSTPVSTGDASPETPSREVATIEHRGPTRSGARRRVRRPRSNQRPSRSPARPRCRRAGRRRARRRRTRRWSRRPRTGSPACARPVGIRISVAVSSVDAQRKTRQKPAASPGAISGSVTRRKASTGREPERPRHLLEPGRGLGDRGQHADERQREEHDRVGDDQQLARLVEAERVADREEDEAQRDHEPGQRLHEVGAALDDASRAGCGGARRASAIGSASDGGERRRRSAA